MKTIFSTLMLTLIAATAAAQDITTVNAANSEISDNLDLRAVASIFGDAANLEDFERKLNDPKLQISNLDLNGDNQVDYLRVIESVEGNTHLIILQSVLARDVFQDVATIEVERDANNNVQVQVVGDVYMYGPNYIYEPVYVHRPVLFTSFWIGGYTPYCSTWYWNYYPSYYYAWHPYPVFRYRRNVYHHINVHHHYNYVNVRRSQRAVAMYHNRRADGYARQYPTRSFQQRHSNVANRYELDQTRNIRDLTVKNSVAANTRNTNVRNTGTRTENTSIRNSGLTSNNSNTRGNAATRYDSAPRENNVRTGGNQNVRAPRAEGSYPTRNQPNAASSGNTRSQPVRAMGNATRENQSIGSTPQRDNSRTRSQSSPQPDRMESSTRPQRAENTPRPNRIQSAPQRNQRVESAPKNNAPRMESAQRQASRSQNNASPRSARGERNGSESRR